MCPTVIHINFYTHTSGFLKNTTKLKDGFICSSALQNRHISLLSIHTGDKMTGTTQDEKQAVCEYWFNLLLKWVLQDKGVASVLVKTEFM